MRLIFQKRSESLLWESRDEPTTKMQRVFILYISCTRFRDLHVYLTWTQYPSPFHPNHCHHFSPENPPKSDPEGNVYPRSTILSRMLLFSFECWDMNHRRIMEKFHYRVSSSVFHFIHRGKQLVEQA